MTDERAAVEFAPLPWEMVPWHIAEDSPHVKCANGWIVCTASSDAMAKLIADSVNESAALRAENERLRAENASLKEANEIDLGEKAPLTLENTALSARVSELTRLLAEAEDAIRDAADETGGEPEFSDERCSYETIQVGYGWRKEWRESAPVQRALQSGEGGK